MTPCDLAQMRLTALLDGELPDADALELESHLTECDACRTARAEIERLLTVADTWQIPAAGLAAERPAAVTTNATEMLLREMAAELRELRAEVRALRAEVAGLRTGRTAGTTATVTRRPDTGQLLPYAPPLETDLLIGTGN